MKQLMQEEMEYVRQIKIVLELELVNALIKLAEINSHHVQIKDQIELIVMKDGIN